MGKYVDKEVKKIVQSDRYKQASDTKKKAMLLNNLKLYRNCFTLCSMNCQNLIDVKNRNQQRI